MIYSQIIQVAGEECVLLLVEPDWSTPVRVSVRLGTEVLETVTGLQERRSEHVLPRLGVEYRTRLTGAALQQLRSVLGGLEHRKVAIAFWPDVDVDVDSTPVLQGQWSVGWNANLQNVVTTPTAELPARAFRAALLLGRLGQQPITALTDEVAEWLLSFTEESPAALAVQATAVAPTVWQEDWPFNWQRLPQQEQRVLLERSFLGRGREPVIDGAEDVRLWKQTALLSLERDKLRSFVAYYCAMLGGLKAFTLPSVLLPGAPTPTAPHEFNPANGRVRFSERELRIDFLTTALADIRVDVEQQLEVTEASEAHTFAFLYRFRYEGLEQRLTDWESNLQAMDSAWTAARIEHGRLRQSLRPQNEECEIKVALADAAILQPLVRLELESPVEVEIFELNLHTQTSQMLFTGAIQSGRAKGKTLTLKASAFGGALRRKVPRFLMTRTCNHTLFSEGCARRRPAQMHPDAWRYQGTLHGQWDANAPRVILATFTSPSGKPNLLSALEGFFAGGWLEVFWNTPQRQLREITWSGTMDGRLFLDVHRVLRDVTAGTAIRFWPGCNGEYNTCRNRFDNTHNFGGFPHAPSWIEQAPMSMPKGGK